MRKCLILGDSISEGIGSKKINYVADLDLLTRHEYEFVNLARTGTTIKYAKDNLDIVLDNNPEIVILMYGSVDAQIRANIEGNKFGINKLIPKRYKIGGMLEPRAFNSKKPIKRILNGIDNVIRFILKRIVLMTQGTVQWVNIRDFEKDYREVVQKLYENQIHLILASTAYLDDKYFLNSSVEYEKYNACIRKIAKEYGYPYLDLYSVLMQSVQDYGWDKYYSHDHFHPNEEGYRFYAECLSKCLLDTWEG